MKNNRALDVVTPLLILQFILTAVIALLLLCLYGSREATSALLGGLVALLPSALFAKKLFAHQGARAAKQIVRNFYLGEALKIMTSVALFALVFLFYEVNPLAFFVTYIVVVMTIWFAPLVLTNKHNGPKSD